MLCIGNVFDEICKKYATRDCIYFPINGEKYTYSEFHEYVNKVAKGLIAMGFTRADHIALKASNSPQWVAMEMAAAKLGIVLVILNANLTVQELAYAMDFTQTKVCLQIIEKKVLIALFLMRNFKKCFKKVRLFLMIY